MGGEAYMNERARRSAWPHPSARVIKSSRRRRNQSSGAGVG